IFVQPPSVPGERPPADYDLYEVEHYSPEPAVQRRLQAWGWPVANVSLEDESIPEARRHVFAFAADARPALVASAGDSPLFRFGGPTPLPPDAVPFNPIVVRIWRETPLGLAHLDHSWPSPLGLGSGYCLFRPNSTLARLAGGDVCNVPPADSDPEVLRMWEPQPSLVATFSTGFRASGALLRGVHAR
ncbi:MAG TPA: hypothetical protein VHI93_04335, partial [Candidatus Thermoplasmatota archaeon]|nr:hypothetical protein [Candidatus Thermoplasmatota archaeon]